MEFGGINILTTCNSHDCEQHESRIIVQLRSGRKTQIYEVIKSDERRRLGKDSHEIFTVSLGASFSLIGISLVQWEAMQTMWNVIT